MVLHYRADDNVSPRISAPALLILPLTGDYVNSPGSLIQHRARLRMLQKDGIGEKGS